MDASIPGFGGMFQSFAVKGTWTLMEPMLIINILVLRTINMAMQHWTPLLQGHAVDYINHHEGSRHHAGVKQTR